MHRIQEDPLRVLAAVVVLVIFVIVIVDLVFAKSFPFDEDE